MNVKDVMTRDVKCCRASDMLSRAAQIMWEQDCGCVPVIDERDEAVGMVTDRDICMAAYTQNLPIASIPVAQVMAKQVFGCGPEDSLEVAEAVMGQHQVRRLPVLGFEGQLLGILSLNDLARAVADKKRDHSPGMSAIAIEATLAAVCKPRKMTDGAPLAIEIS